MGVHDRFRVVTKRGQEVRKTEREMQIFLRVGHTMKCWMDKLSAWQCSNGRVGERIRKR